MRKNNLILVTGGCGFVGTNLCVYLKKNLSNFKIFSADNLKRDYSKYNLKILEQNKIKNYKVDVSKKEFFKIKKKFKIIIDCCADPAVETSKKKIEDVFNNNLKSTLNILEKTRKDHSKLIFISSSRVYPINESIKKFKKKKHSSYNEKTKLDGVKSLYGYTKFSSEQLIEEFSYIFNIKFLINRMGIITGPLQFGKVEQGLISLWLWKHMNKKSIKYIGYGGKGVQIRDVLHVEDFCELIMKQIKQIEKKHNYLFCIGGGRKNTINLRKLTKECEKITGNKIKIGSDSRTSKYDIPMFVSSNNKIKKFYNWKPKFNIKQILNSNYKWMNENQMELKKYFK